MFSIIVPVYNKLPHLERSVNSVLNQSFKAFELILIDDASTDGSSEKLATFSDPRIKILKRETPGPGGYAARNLGIKNAAYEWVSFIDADDEWEIDYLQKVNAVITENKSVEVITCGWEKVNSKKEKINKGSYNKGSNKILEFTLINYLQSNKYMWTSASTIKKDLIKEVGMFPEGLCKRGGDIDTWIRCLYKSRSNIYINEMLAYYYRDTVNQVTDRKKNISKKICSLNTLKRLRKETNDKELCKVIDVSIETKIFDHIFSQMKEGLAIDHSLLKEINAYHKRLLTVIKLYTKKVLISFK